MSWRPRSGGVAPWMPNYSGWPPRPPDLPIASRGGPQDYVRTLAKQAWITASDERYFTGQLEELLKIQPLLTRILRLKDPDKEDVCVGDEVLEKLMEALGRS